MNPQNKYPRRLPKSRLIVGRKPLIEALKNEVAIEKIYMLNGASGRDIQEIATLAKAQNISIRKVPQVKINQLTNINTQGVVAIAGLISYQQLQNIIDFKVGKGLTPLLLVLDGVTDTRNLGAVARSALCFDVDALVLPAANSAGITEEAIKASAGALETLPICRMSSLENIFDTLYLNGIQIIATDLKADDAIQTVDWQLPTAIIMGAEDLGISKISAEKATKRIKIPQNNKLDSLNISVATGIVLYECFKTRNS